MANIVLASHDEHPVRLPAPNDLGYPTRLN